MAYRYVFCCTDAKTAVEIMLSGILRLIIRKKFLLMKLEVNLSASLSVFFINYIEAFSNLKIFILTENIIESNTDILAM